MKKIYNLIAFLIAVIAMAQQQTVTYSISPAAFNEDESITITFNGSSINESTWALQTTHFIFGPGLTTPMTLTVRIAQRMALGPLQTKPTS